MASIDGGKGMAKHIDVANLLRRFPRRPSGQVFLLVTVALVVLIGMAALAVDIGNLWTTRRLMQSAADAGAVAGADEIAIGGSGSAITAAAKDASSHNGFVDGGTRPGTSNTITVAVHNPPTSGPFAANSNAVQVDVSQTQPTYFMKVLGWQSVPVSTTAVAVTQGSGSCVYSLDRTAPGALTVAGTASVNSACGMYVNSDSSSALTVSGGGTVTSSLVGVVGGTNVNGGGSTPPSTGIKSFGDPLAYIPAPSFDPSSCSSFHNTALNGSISPGTFCGGISVSTGSNVTFNQGLYVIDGGGIKITGGTVSGSGVTFYLTGNNGSGSSPATYSGVTINGGAVNFTSPCSSSGGSIAGMLFFQDRSIIATGSNGSTINGNAGSTFSGAIYFPTTSLSYAGTTGANMFTLLVSDMLTFTGNSSVGNNYSCLANGSLIKDAALVQ
jgi:Flp pilus assembly protein TadG